MLLVLRRDTKGLHHVSRRFGENEALRSLDPSKLEDGPRRDLNPKKWNVCRTHLSEVELLMKGSFDGAVRGWAQPLEHSAALRHLHSPLPFLDVCKPCKGS